MGAAEAARLPGGHLTTNEEPEALAALIESFERRTSPMPDRVLLPKNASFRQQLTFHSGSLTVASRAL
jgi:hypothetical protein